MRIRSGLIALVVSAAAMPAAQAGEGFAGFYGGFTAGSHSHKSDWYTGDLRYRNNTAVDPSLPQPGFGQPPRPLIPNGTSLPAPLSDTETSFKDTVYGVGLVLGYNWELAPKFLVGLEVAVGAAPTYDRTDDAFPGLGSTADDPMTYAAVKTSKPLVAGLKLGYEVVPNTLAYVRGNYERVTLTAIGGSSDCPASYLNNNSAGTPPTPRPCDVDVPVGTYRNSAKLYGWGYGLGVEHKFGEVMALRLEYRRAEYGKTSSATVIPESDTTFGADALVDLHHANIVELGLIFHF